MTSLVGRQQALAEAAELVGGHRLVTLVGPPGVGKSRLALEAARAVEPDFAGGVWFVELARAGRPADVARVVARTLDARGPTPSRDPLARVVQFLRQANVLLVLDGCEPVIEEAARVAAGVLAECPGVRVLATSREVLHLDGEVRLVVAPLAVPAAGADAGELAGSESVRLFLERARAARPGLPLTEDRLALAAEICRRVDGLPLAIELAAARVSVLGLREILSALESRRPLFVDARDRRAVPQRYLRTVVAWSHDLLHADEKALLHQLAVFRGGAPLSAVVATAARGQMDAARVTQLLGALVDKSILTASFPDGGGALRPARHRPRVRRRAAGQGRQPGRGPAGACRILRDHGRRRADRASRARLAGLHQAAGAGARQPLGGAGVRTRRPRPCDRGPAGGGAGLVLRARRAGLRGAQLPRGCAGAADARACKRIELLAWLCYLATEELDLDAAIDAGERGLALAAKSDAPVGNRDTTSWRSRSRTIAPGRSSARSSSPTKRAARSTS